MSDLVTAILVVLVALVVFAVGCARRRARFTIDQTSERVSAVDGMRYRVHERHDESQAAADMLGALNDRIIRLMRHLRREYGQAALPGAPPGAFLAGAGPRAEAVRLLLSRYNPDNLAENSPRDPTGDTSYSLDKGAIVAICLRKRGSSETILDLETVTFVAIHELAHLALEDIGHPPAFWAVFRFLLEAAEDAGVYRSINFARSPRAYCGVSIDYNPRYDPACPALA